MFTRTVIDFFQNPNHVYGLNTIQVLIGHLGENDILVSGI
jgi:hypothetical protein